MTVLHMLLTMPISCIICHHSYLRSFLFSTILPMALGVLPTTLVPHVIALDVNELAKENQMPKCSNVILLGAAAAFFTLIDKEELYKSIDRIFGSKGEAIVEMNHRALNIGYDYALNMKNK